MDEKPMGTNDQAAKKISGSMRAINFIIAFFVSFLPSLVVSFSITLALCKPLGDCSEGALGFLILMFPVAFLIIFFLTLAVLERIEHRSGLINQVNKDIKAN